LLASLTLRPWGWRQYVTLKHQWTSVKLHCAISQDIILFRVTAVRIYLKSHNSLWLQLSLIRQGTWASTETEMSLADWLFWMHWKQWAPPQSPIQWILGGSFTRAWNRPLSFNKYWG
jgi:hypothetical protein